MTGGRWRRIVLGDVLAEHVVELRGRPVSVIAVIVSGRGGSGSFGSGRTPLGKGESLLAGKVLYNRIYLISQEGRD